MTVEELIEKLSKFPKDKQVLHRGYLGNHNVVIKVSDCNDTYTSGKPIVEGGYVLLTDGIPDL